MSGLVLAGGPYHRLVCEPPQFPGWFRPADQLTLNESRYLVTHRQVGPLLIAVYCDPDDAEFLASCERYASPFIFGPAKVSWPVGGYNRAPISAADWL